MKKRHFPETKEFLLEKLCFRREKRGFFCVTLQLLFSL